MRLHFTYLNSIQTEKEKRQAKVQQIRTETQSLVSETPEQRADRLAAELIAVVLFHLFSAYIYYVI